MAYCLAKFMSNCGCHPSVVGTLKAEVVLRDWVLSVHVTGGFINPEFEGAMPLQIVNNNSFPIAIYPYITICQLLLSEISATPLIPYPRRSNNPYHKESNAGPSMIGKDPALSDGGQFLPNLNREIEYRLLSNYLNELNAEDEKRRMIDAINESSPKSVEQQQSVSRTLLLALLMPAPLPISMHPLRRL